MPTTVVKVGLDPKRPTQYRVSKSITTGVVTTTAVQNWIVCFSAPQSDPSACYHATDGTRTVPQIGDYYPGTSGAYAPFVYDVNPQLDPQSAGKAYKVQVSFSTSAATSSTGKWDVQISFDGAPLQESYFFDLDKSPVLNAAGQSFTSQPNRTYYDEAIKISFKTTSFDETDAEGVRGMLNESDETLTISALGYTRTFPAKTLLLVNFSASPVVNLGSLAYWQVSLDLNYRALITAPTQCQTWAGTSLSGSISTQQYDIIANLGYAYLDDPSTDSELTTFTDKTTKKELNAPQFLDFDGGDGRPSGTPTEADAYFLAFRKADTGDFSVLFTGIS